VTVGKAEPFQQRNPSVSIDELSAEQKSQAKQYVFWTAVAVVAGFVLFVVL
jgi:hypothetical protein